MSLPGGSEPIIIRDGDDAPAVIETRSDYLFTTASNHITQSLQVSLGYSYVTTTMSVKRTNGWTN